MSQISLIRPRRRVEVDKIFFYSSSRLGINNAVSFVSKVVFCDPVALKFKFFWVESVKNSLWSVGKFDDILAFYAEFSQIIYKNEMKMWAQDCATLNKIFWQKKNWNNHAVVEISKKISDQNQHENFDLSEYLS